MYVYLYIYIFIYIYIYRTWSAGNLQQGAVNDNPDSRPSSREPDTEVCVCVDVMRERECVCMHMMLYV